MAIMYRRVLAVLAAWLLFQATPGVAWAHGRHHAKTRYIAGSQTPNELYSSRALRRVKLILEMRLLEFRKERLECVRQAILRNLPPELRPHEAGPGGTRRLRPETCQRLLQ
jgi:hypothetical protein